MSGNFSLVLKQAMATNISFTVDDGCFMLILCFKFGGSITNNIKLNNVSKAADRYFNIQSGEQMAQYDVNVGDVFTYSGSGGASATLIACYNT